MFYDLSAVDFLTNRADFDVIMDARSPSEFAQAHIPNAINFYALNDEERADIGTLYKRTPFEARALGAAFVCKNISENLENFAKNITPSRKIAIYCARGGMRSSSIAVVLANIGYRIWRIKGGFKAYRNEVLAFFDDLPDYQFITIDGLTGSGKSEIIRAIDWSVDLEKLANHKGSSFGEIDGDQPKTAAFENELQFALARFNANEQIAIESESKSIGRVVVPPKLYAAFTRGFRIYIESSISDRVARITHDYSAIKEEFFLAAMGRISPYIPRKIADGAKAAFFRRDLAECAFLLITEYYDKVYKKSAAIDAVLRFDSLENAVKDLESIRCRLAAQKGASY